MYFVASVFCPMANNYFQFQQFTIHQDQCAMKVSTEACILGALADTEKPNRILDIGTGTGVLALMLAQRYNCPVDAVEIDKNAAGQAMENVKKSPWSRRIQVFNRNIREFAESNRQKYDLIVCNPPFFKDSEKSDNDAANLARHETETFSMKLLAEVMKKLLSFTGKAFVIYPKFEALKFADILESQNLRGHFNTVIRNQPDDKVFRMILEIQKSNSFAPSHNLSIREGNEYSQDLRLLMSDYYKKI